MQGKRFGGPSHRGQAKRRSWRPSFVTIAIALLIVIGMGVFLYPQAASWFAQYRQSKQIDAYSKHVSGPDMQPSAADQILNAYRYNDALNAGAIIGANENKPTSTVSQNSQFDYNKLLAADSGGLMARIKMEAIDLDLPIYHGTSDETLMHGAGHLEGSSLPVGGESTHSVITAHRGLATATMFSNLDQVVEGDRFTIEVFGEVLTYEVRTKIVVDPKDTETLHAQEGRDLVTLITCTPLGINSHRILVTAERVTPTPIRDIEQSGATPVIPGFPWWAVIGGVGLLASGIFVWRSGYSDARLREIRARKKAATDTGDATPWDMEPTPTGPPTVGTTSVSETPVP